MFHIKFFAGLVKHSNFDSNGQSELFYREYNCKHAIH